MAGHSKWNNIKHKKAISDVKRAKAFTQHSRQISVAARGGGGDPDLNSALKLAIENAKKDNVPNENIERAIKKGTGELKDASIIEEVYYEAYGPGGIAILIRALTDNNNRTVANIKTILQKHGGRLGGPGSVSFLFSRKGVVFLQLENQKKEARSLFAIDHGAESIIDHGDVVEFHFSPERFFEAHSGFPQQEIISSSIDMVPNTTTSLLESQQEQLLLKLLESIDDDDDVAHVTCNLSKRYKYITKD